jgi:hypothetical protein
MHGYQVNIGVYACLLMSCIGNPAVIIINRLSWLAYGSTDTVNNIWYWQGQLWEFLCLEVISAQYACIISHGVGQARNCLSSGFKSIRKDFRMCWKKFIINNILMYWNNLFHVILLNAHIIIAVCFLFKTSKAFKNINICLLEIYFMYLILKVKHGCQAFWVKNMVMLRFNNVCSYRQINEERNTAFWVPE